MKINDVILKLKIFKVSSANDLCKCLEEDNIQKKK